MTKIIMRVLLHYTHKQTLGHTSRSISLAAALLRHQAEVLVLQGGLPQPFVAFPPKCRVIDIPLAFDNRLSFQAPGVPQSPAKRAAFILKIAADFSPDVFITESFPFDRLTYLPELLPILRYLRKKGKRIISSIGYPLPMELDRLMKEPTFAALQKRVFKFFDNFLIHTPEKLENPYIEKTIVSKELAAFYATFMKNLEKRTIYTGYIFPEKIISDDAATLGPEHQRVSGTRTRLKHSGMTNHSTKTIVISRGGGAVYPKLITKAIEAQRLIDGPIQTIMATGPATTVPEMALFQSCLKPNDKGRVFLTHLADLDSYLRKAQVSVSLCGYNTSVQLMRYGTPAVIVPYKNRLSKESTNDQIARAQLLKDRFSSTILDYETMTAASLAEAIKNQMAAPHPKPAPVTWFNGADIATKFIML